MSGCPRPVRLIGSACVSPTRSSAIRPGLRRWRCSCRARRSPFGRIRCASRSLAATGRIEIGSGRTRVIPAGRSVRLVRGESFRVRAPGAAICAYLAIEGGPAIAPLLGSASTYVRSGIGGFHGRALRQGDSLPLARAGVEVRDERALAQPLDPALEQPIRVVMGPQRDYFTDDGGRHVALVAVRHFEPGRSDGLPPRRSRARACQGLRHRVRRHRHGRDPGAGLRPADRPLGRPPDDGRLSQDRHGDFGRRSCPRAAKARPRGSLRCRGRRGRAASTTGTRRPPFSALSTVFAASRRPAKSTWPRFTRKIWSAESPVHSIEAGSER